MTTEHAAEVIWFVVLTAGLVGWFQWIWVPLRAEVLRQDAFSLRRRLFLAAADGKLPFEHDAYRTAVDNLNNTIRFAERLSLWRVVFVGLAGRKLSGPEISRPPDEASLTPEARAELAAIREGLTNAIGGHMATTSPMLMSLSVVIVAFVLPVLVVRELGKRLRQSFDARLSAVSYAESMTPRAIRMHRSSDVHVSFDERKSRLRRWLYRPVRLGEIERDLRAMRQAEASYA